MTSRAPIRHNSINIRKLTDWPPIENWEDNSKRCVREMSQKGENVEIVKYAFEVKDLTKVILQRPACYCTLIMSARSRHML